MTVEGSDLEPGGEPSGPQDDLDSKLGVPVLRLSHTTRVPPQDVADKLEKARSDSGRLGVSDKGMPVPEGANLSADMLNHIEHVAGVYVRDSVEHLYRLMKIEQREWFFSKIPPEGGEPLSVINQMKITRELLEQFRLRARSREGDFSLFDIASVVDPSKVLFTVRTRINKIKANGVGNGVASDQITTPEDQARDSSALLEALQWMDSVDTLPDPAPEEVDMPMVSKEEAQIIWDYAGAPIGFLAQRNLLTPEDHKALLDGARKEFPAPDAEERRIIVTRARERDQMAVEAAIMDFQQDYPDDQDAELAPETVEVEDFDESKLVLTDSADGEIDDKDLIVDDHTVFIDPDPTIPPQPPQKLTGRPASNKPPVSFGESTDLSHSLMGIPAPVTSSDSSEGSVVVMRGKRSPSAKFEPSSDADDDDVAPSAPMPGPITSRYNRDDLVKRGVPEASSTQPPTPVVSAPPPKPSRLKRFARFLFWLVIIVVLVALGGYVFIDIKVGDVPSRWDGQVSVASVTSLITYPPPKPEPVVIPLEDRPLVMADGAQVAQIRERWLVSVPLRKQIDRPIIFNKDGVELTFIAERSKDERGLRYIGCESELIGDMIHLRVFLLASMDLDVRMIDIIPFIVDK